MLSPPTANVSRQELAGLSDAICRLRRLPRPTPLAGPHFGPRAQHTSARGPVNIRPNRVWLRTLNKTRGSQTSIRPVSPTHRAMQSGRLAPTQERGAAPTPTYAAVFDLSPRPASPTSHALASRHARHLVSRETATHAAAHLWAPTDLLLRSHREHRVCGGVSPARTSISAAASA